MKYLNIPSNYNFFDSLYYFLMNEFDNNISIADITIFLPSRRSVNELKRVFLQHKKTVFLPNIKAIGDIDYDDLILNDLNIDVLKELNSLTKPVSNIKYKLLLIEELLKNYNSNQAISMADELNNFLSDVEKNNCNLDDLDDLVSDDYSEHWQKILDFLKVFLKKWQKFLNENNITSANKYKVQTIEYYNRNYKQVNELNHPIIIAGNMLTIAGTTELISSLSKFNNSYLIFKGFEKFNKDETKYINEFCPYYFYYNFVNKVNLDTNLIKDIIFSECKIITDEEKNIMFNSMLPNELVQTWDRNNTVQLNNVELIECDNIFDEINSICFYILDFISKNGMRNIAIIANSEYSDDLSIYLKKYNLPVNNTFGTRFIHTKLAKLILLILNNVLDDFKIDEFLALLKNEYTIFSEQQELIDGVGYISKAFPINTISLDGFIHQAKQCMEHRAECKGKTADDCKLIYDFLIKIKQIFSPLIDKKEQTLYEFINNTLKILNEIIIKDKLNNTGDDKIIDFINDFMDESKDFRTIDLDTYKSLLSYFLSQQSYSEEFSFYPAVNIIKNDEARLINYDLVVLFNCNDGNFPVNVANDFLMNNSMRKQFGLFSKNCEVGKMALDFIQLLNNKQVLITRSIKLDDSITFKSRFLQRLETYLRYTGTEIKKNDIIPQYVYEDKYVEKANCAKRPLPTYDISKIKSISATNFEVLLSNPYDFYAKFALKLYENNFLLAFNPSSYFGTVIHAIFEDYVKEYDNVDKNIIKLVEDKINEYFCNNEIAKELHHDDIVELSQSFYVLDSERRESGLKITAEKEYRCNYNGMELTARIDRLEENGNDVNLIDYKTSTSYKKRDITDGKKAQLPFTAFILQQNGKNINLIEYWRRDKKNLKPESVDGKQLQEILEKFKKYFDMAIQYFTENKTFKATNYNQYSNYSHLSRVDEWLYEDGNISNDD